MNQRTGSEALQQHLLVADAACGIDDEREFEIDICFLLGACIGQ